MYVAKFHQSAQAARSPHERIMCAAWPLSYDVKQLQLRIAYRLYINGMYALSIHVCFLMRYGRLDRNMSSIDGSNHIWKTCDSMKCMLVRNDVLLRSWKLDDFIGMTAQRRRDVSYHPAHAGLRQTDTSAEHPLKTTRRVETQRSQHLGVDRNWSRSGCFSFQVKTQHIAQCDHIVSRKPCHLKHSIISQVFYGQVGANWSVVVIVIVHMAYRCAIVDLATYLVYTLNKK